MRSVSTTLACALRTVLYSCIACKAYCAPMAFGGWFKVCTNLLRSMLCLINIFRYWAWRGAGSEASEIRIEIVADQRRACCRGAVKALLSPDNQHYFSKIVYRNSSCIAIGRFPTRRNVAATPCFVNRWTKIGMFHVDFIHSLN